MTDKTTLVVTSVPNPDQPDAIEAYVQGVMPLLLGLGGVLVKRMRVTDVKHGEQRFAVMLVMDFPSKDALIEMFDGDAYKALIPARDKAFKSIDILFADDLN